VDLEQTHRMWQVAFILIPIAHLIEHSYPILSSQDWQMDIKMGR